MTFNFKISRWANFYFFVQNLAEWHFSNRPDYNVLWHKELEFSEEERSVFGNFKNIHLKYSFGKNYLGRYFFNPEETNPFELMTGQVEENDINEIKKVFEVLENKFSVLYEKESPLLEKWRETLVRSFSDEEAKTNVVEKLNKFFGAEVANESVNVFLLCSSENHMGGGANIGKNNLTLEASRYSTELALYVAGSIWHEITHLLFQSYIFTPLLEEHSLLNADKGSFNLFNEIIVSSLFPRGILGIRLLKNNPAARFYQNVDEAKTIQIIDLAKDYINKEKTIDKDFILALEDIVKK